MHIQHWGSGQPVIALHPLALESTAFAGVATLLQRQGLRTLAADLPGFGQTPTGDEPLDAERLARPVIELARSLESPPVVLGMSLGARVALEAALIEPTAFRGLALCVPYLPWIAKRWLMPVGHLISPDLAERVPLEIAWPLLKRLSDGLDGVSYLENDWLARASVRVAYNLSCPATRRHLISATREMVLEPAFGPGGTWTRLPDLEVPAAFLWNGRDWLIPGSHRDEVARRLPTARQLELPCCGHFVNGRHHPCFDHAMALAVRRVIEEARGRRPLPHRAVEGGPVVEICRCVAARAGGGTGEPQQSTGADRPSESEGIERASAGDAMRRLSGEDSVFIYGETENMPMHTIGAMILDPSTVDGATFGYERVVEALAARVHLMPPFRQRLVEVPLGLARPVLADDPGFSVENHVRRVSLDAPGDLRALARVVAPFAGAPLDRGKPLWEMLYVDGLENGRVALVTKLHHCMLDGASGANQMAGFLDLEPEPDEQPPAPPWHPEPLPSRLGLTARALVPSIPNPVAIVSLAARAAKGYYRKTAVRLERTSALGLLWSSLDRPPRTRFSGAITPNRTIAFASASLRDIKTVKNAFGVTVNDVVLAACTLALRQYLSDNNDLPSEPIRCGVPVSIKSDEEKREFSNKVSSMTVKLPTGLDNAGELLEAIHEETDAAKREFLAGSAEDLVEWLDLAWPGVFGVLSRLASATRVADWVPLLWNLVVSNMTGPPVPLYLAGARVEAIYPMGPISEGTGLNITVLSNMDRVDVGLLACKETVPHLWRLAEGFEDAVLTLKAAAAERAAA